MADKRFQMLWDDLVGRCPWATVYQERSYAQVWFRCYQRDFEPVIIHSLDSEPSFLLPLALGRDGLVLVGGRQAEYQAWLSTDTTSRSIEKGLELLSKHIDWDRVVLRYLPPGFPVQTIPRDRTFLEPFKRPVMRVENVDEIHASLRKKGNKSKLNGLKKHGEVVLEYVTEIDRLRMFLNDLLLTYDFRQGATHRSIPFEQDPYKLDFLLAMAADLAVTHCTVLRVNETPVAGHIGRISGRTVHNGILASSPFYGKYSPGKLHILQLGLLLHEQGFKAFDLTPGDDDWKERFANDHDQVHLAIIERSKLRHCLRSSGRLLKSSLKKTAKGLNISPSRARAILGKVRSVATGGLPANAQIESGQELSLGLYIGASVDAPIVERGTIISRDNLGDLLELSRAQKAVNRFDFLAGALRRIESGDQHFYTCRKESRVASIAWVEENVRLLNLPGRSFELLFPGESVVLHDFLSIRRWLPVGEFGAFLVQVTQEIKNLWPKLTIYFLLPASDREQTSCAVQAGFTFLGGVRLSSFGTKAKISVGRSALSIAPESVQ